MASILVFMEQREAQLSPRSKRVLAQGRSIASHLGATLYAVASENEDDNDAWIAEAGLSGADKVVLLSFPAPSEEFPEPQNAEEPGLLTAALMSVCDALHPNLVLFDDTRMGTIVAPAIANHLAALQLEGAIVHCLDDGDMVLEQRSSDRRTRRQLSVTKSQAPVVATLSAAAVEPTQGKDDADVIFFKAPRYPVTLSVTTLGTDAASPPDPALDGDIVVGAGLGAQEMLTEVRELAATLGAPLVYTKRLSDHLQTTNGEPECPIVGKSSNHIAPRLYVSCGAEGSDEHLAAIAAGTQILTLGRQPACPSVLAARYACIGELEETLPKLVRAAGAKPAASSFASSFATVALPTPVQASTTMAFAPSPDSVELFTDAEALVERLQQDGLWTP